VQLWARNEEYVEEWFSECFDNEVYQPIVLGNKQDLLNEEPRNSSGNIGKTKI